MGVSGSERASGKGSEWVSESVSTVSVNASRNDAEKEEKGKQLSARTYTHHIHTDIHALKDAGVSRVSSCEHRVSRETETERQRDRETERQRKIR